MRDNSWNRGFDMIDDHIAILEHDLLSKRISDNEDYKELSSDDIYDKSGMYVYVDDNGEDAKIDLHDMLYSEVVQSDWEEEDPEEMSFIQNKPVIGETVVEEGFYTTKGVGGYKAGEPVPEGTEWAMVVKKILCGLESDVQMYWDIRYDEPEDWKVKNFRRTNNPGNTEYWGNKGYGGYAVVKRSELLNNGWSWPGKFTIHHEEENPYITSEDSEEGPIIYYGGYNVLAIDTNSLLDVDEYKQEGLLINNNEGLQCRVSGGWKYFYLARPTTGTFDEAIYSFKEHEQDDSEGIYIKVNGDKGMAYSSDGLEVKISDNFSGLYFNSEGEIELDLANAIDGYSVFLNEDSELASIFYAEYGIITPQEIDDAIEIVKATGEICSMTIKMKYNDRVYDFIGKKSLGNNKYVYSFTAPDVDKMYCITLNYNWATDSSIWSNFELEYGGVTEQMLEEAIMDEASRVDALLNLKADKTEIPTLVSQLANDAGYLTEHQDISGKQDKLIAGDNIIIDGVTIKLDDSAIPTRTSQLENDGQGNGPYATQNWVYGRQYVDATDLELAVADKVTYTDFNNHKDDTNVHINAEDRARWEAKQDELVAGDNINITGNVISAVDTTYEAGSGIVLTGNTFELASKNLSYFINDTNFVNETQLNAVKAIADANTAKNTQQDQSLNQLATDIANTNGRIGATELDVLGLKTGKQNVLTAGQNITITGNVISAASANVYEDGTNIDVVQVGPGRFTINNKIEKLSQLTNDIRNLTEDNTASVAVTGSYNDLIDKPEIPQAKNGELLIQVNSTDLARFTADQETNTVANIIVPTKYSDLTADIDYWLKSEHDDTKQDMLIPGNAVSMANNTLNVLYDNHTITLESNALTVQPKTLIDNDSLHYDLASGEISVSNPLPQPTTEAKNNGYALVVKPDGSYGFGEAGKLDDVLYKGTSLVSNKVADLSNFAIDSEVVSITTFNTYKSTVDQSIEDLDDDKQDNLSDGIATKVNDDKIDVLYDSHTLDIHNTELRVKDVALQSLVSYGSRNYLSDIMPTGFNADADNYLADQVWVIDKLSSLLGTFRGSYDSLTDLSVAYPAGMSGLANVIANNDYAYTIVPNSEGNLLTRYKAIASYNEATKIYTLNSWQPEYSINIPDVPLTSTEMAALQSGITAARVALYDSYEADKQDTLTPGNAIEITAANRINVLYDNDTVQLKSNKLAVDVMTEAEVVAIITNAFSGKI